MLSKEKKLELAKKITQSNTFKNAPTSIALLKYLVQTNIDERELKEGIIDIEFFGGQSDKDKNNPRVRVNIFNLRNKLHKYYLSEGINDLWQLKIDKGQYRLRFEKQGLQQRHIINKKYVQAVPYLLLSILITVLIFHNLADSPPQIWKAFFNNNHTTNLFIGDAFGYGGKTISGLHGWTRDFSVNSLDDYYEMVEQQPQLISTTSPTDYFYSKRMAENATHDLSRYFTKWGRDFEIKYATRTSFSDIKKDNTIYVGRLKYQKNFTYLFNEGNPYFKVKDRSIEFSGHPILKDTSFVVSTNETDQDYAIVARIPGPHHTEQFLFFSDHDIGVMGTVELFTNEDAIKSFATKHLKDKSYFVAIYKAKGKERINLDMKEVLIVPFE
ncbi:hypothetical protein JCM21142_62374 [Saccharicrinis fermentans DSM 9555 = JCM 21142]|uniref:Uncharacterized protein n=2 Tax=Saccharicrinis fermentans TaxID=982 RepID=W7XYJ9_9BACT|nr:hypothetical protein JCM21142_62374 [Saccharicrinis fermentans DSM 9555 = JCM 21142]